MANETEAQRSPEESDLPKYSSDSHTDNAPLFSDSLFDFMINLRENTDTFSPEFYDAEWLHTFIRDVNRTGPIRPADILPDHQIRTLVRAYTGEFTDLETLD